MLDITFYSGDKEEAEVIEVSDDFYHWLARSEFSRIGKSEIKEMKVDGEPVEVAVIQLEGMNRRKLSDFFRDAIVQETDEMLDKLGSSPSKEAYQEATYRLLLLQRLRKQIEKEQYKYFQRY
ncbi:MAG TPA: hypothetical protein DDW76_01900 [Cyanobacteria bacterium UBA11369]|nr:hypothetical protein [Cyanobacteria bacterium UBA11371]HBE31604.1 hypothetical protein [Cyanobacteria bacterium UBA11368]HBE47583.1 hypothetical protein [Cyanobacteria bacterium UBA11369]